MAEGRPPHGRFRRWLLRPAAWLLALLALLAGALTFASRSGWLHERARVAAESRLSAALGRVVRIERLELALVPLEVEAWGVSVAGPRPTDPPLAEIAHLAVVADLEGTTRPVLTVREVRLDGPVFRLHLLADGSDNLPAIARQGDGGEKLSTGRVRLRMGGLEIRDGWFELGEDRLPLSLTARGVEGDLVGAGDALLGEARVQEVEVLLPGARPYRVTISGRARLLTDRIELRAVEVVGPELAAHLAGEVVWRGTNRIHLAGHVESSDRLARELGYFSEPLFGRIEVDGKYLWESGRPWSVTGTFAVPSLDLWDLRAEGLAGELALGADELRVAVGSGRLLGGSLDGRLHFDLSSSEKPMELDLNLAGTSLERLLASREIVLGAPVDAALSGTVRLRVPLGGGGGTEGAIELAVAPEGRAGAASLSGPAVFDVREGWLASREVALSGETVALRASGAFELASESGGFDYVATTGRLGELARLLPVAVDPAAPPLWMPTSGAGRLAGRLELSPERVSTHLVLDLLDVAAPGLAADRVEGEMAVDSLGLDELRLVAHRGAMSISVSGRLPFSESAPLALRVEPKDWPLADLRPWLPLELPLQGPLRADLELGGSLAALTGTASAEISPAVLGGVECRSVAATFRFDPERLHVERAKASLAAGSLSASGELELAAERLDLALASSALDLSAPPFSDLTPLALSGRAGLSGTVRGTLAAPDLDLSFRTTGVEVAGEALPDSELRLRWADGAMRVSGSLLNLVEVSGGGPVDRHQAALAVHLVASDLRTIARIAGFPADLALGGRLAGDLAVKGTLFGDGPVTAQLTIAEVDLELAGHRVLALEPVTIDLASDRLELGSVYLGERASGSELFVSGRIGLTGDRPLDLRLQASLPASLLEAVAPGLTMLGQVEALAAIRGTLAHPRVSGQAELEGGRLLLADFPHTFDQVKASVLFYPDRLVLDSASAELGGGRLRGGGTLAWQGTERGDGPEYRFQLAAERVGLRYPAGWLLRGDADLTLQSQGEGRLLRGVVRLDRAYYLQNLSANLGQMMSRLLERQRLQAASTDELLAGTSLAISVQAPQALRVRNNLADLRGSADLSVRGSLAQPTLFGRVEAERGGKIVYSGNDYVVERARLTFANPMRIEPVVDLEARAKVDEYDIKMNLAGTLDRLSATFSSDPPLPSFDVLGLLAVGRPVTAGGAAPLPGSPEAAGSSGSSGSLGAEGLLYSQAASLLSSRVEGLFGLDKLRIDPLGSGRDVVSTARVTVGKRLSRRLYVTYTLDPSTAEQQQVQAEWQFSDQLLLVLTQNGAGSYAVDMRWEKRF